MAGKKKKVFIISFLVMVLLLVPVFQIFLPGKKQMVISAREDETIVPSLSAEPDIFPQTEKETVSETDRAAEMIYVHICGAVKKEGLLSLPKGSRVDDAVCLAGGFLDTADRQYLNLAALLCDGQKLYVPTTEETAGLPPLWQTEQQNEAEAEKTQGKPEKINLNTATKEELMTLSGIGAAKAEEILNYRRKLLAFQNVEEIKKVPGIGDAMYEKIKDDIFVE